jgi:hypothetical protein
MAVSAFWSSVPAMPVTTSTVPPLLEARGEAEEELGEAATTAIILVVVACLLPFAVLLVQMSRKYRLVFIYADKQIFDKSKKNLKTRLVQSVFDTCTRCDVNGAFSGYEYV